MNWCQVEVKNICFNTADLRIGRFDFRVGRFDPDTLAIGRFDQPPVVVDKVSVSVLYTETNATLCKFLVYPNKSSNHYKKPSPVHISGLNIVKHT